MSVFLIHKIRSPRVRTSSGGLVGNDLLSSNRASSPPLLREAERGVEMVSGYGSRWEAVASPTKVGPRNRTGNVPEFKLNRPHGRRPACWETWRGNCGRPEGEDTLAAAPNETGGNKDSGERFQFPWACE